MKFTLPMVTQFIRTAKMEIDNNDEIETNPTNRNAEPIPYRPN